MKRTFPLLAGLGLAISLALPGAALAAEAKAATPPATQSLGSLTPEVLYTFLIGEIAGARGEVGLALEAYLNIARATRDPRIARRATEIALHARNLTATTEAARIWAEADPQSEDARRILATATGGGGQRLDEVQAQFARALANSPDQLEHNLMNLNRAFAGVPDRHAVRMVIDRLTEPYLDRPEAHFARAHAALSAGDGIEALAGAERALELRADWEPAVLLKTHVMMQSGAIIEATELLERHLKRHPESSQARLTYARALVSARRFEAAHNEFRTLLEASPEDRDLNYAVALLSAQLGDIDNAEALFQKALAAGHPESDTIRLNLGQIAERRKDAERALDWYRKVQPGPHHLDAQMRIAGVLARQGKMAQAREHLRAIEGDETARKQILLAETQLLRDAGHDLEAFELVDTALTRSPEDPELLYESSMLAEKLDRIEVMEERLRKLIEIKPDHAHAYNALGYSLADRGMRLEEAEEMIGRALELAPNDPFILDSMGWVQFRRGNAQQALEHLRRAYAMRPDPEIAAHLGEVLWATNQRDDAQKVWNEAMQAFPDNPALKRTVERLRGQ